MARQTLEKVARRAIGAQMPATPSTNRLHFFDNVRYLVIIWVTLFHVASGFAGHQEFIRDSNTSVVFSIFHGYSITVMMAIMFFSAGYFATPALRHRRTGQFLQCLSVPISCGTRFSPDEFYLGSIALYKVYCDWHNRTRR